MKIAILDPNILAGLGLKVLLKDVIPMAEIDLFTTFHSFEECAGEYMHYFVSARIYFEYVSFFKSGSRPMVILVGGDMLIPGCITLNVCQSEQALATSILRLMHSAHHGHSAAPHLGDKTTERDGCQVLSPREIEVAVLLTRSFINKEIADKLHISLATVISHRKNIMEKLHARSLADITIYAILNGLVDISEV